MKWASDFFFCKVINFFLLLIYCMHSFFCPPNSAPDVTPCYLPPTSQDRDFVSSPSHTLLCWLTCGLKGQSEIWFFFNFIIYSHLFPFYKKISLSLYKKWTLFHRFTTSRVMHLCFYASRDIWFFSNIPHQGVKRILTVIFAYQKHYRK